MVELYLGNAYFGQHFGNLQAVTKTGAPHETLFALYQSTATGLRAVGIDR